MLRLKIGVEGGSRGTQFKGELNDYTISKFKKWSKTAYGDYVGAEIVKKAGAKVFAIESFLGDITSKEFYDKASSYLKQHIDSAYVEKFKSHGFGRWRALKESTIRKRRWMMGQKVTQGKGKYASTVLFKANMERGASASSPLWFSGHMKEAIMDGTQIGEFRFFNRRKFNFGILEYTGFKLRTKFIEPDKSNVPRWYWSPTSTKQTWVRLIQHQERKRWKIGLTTKEFYEHAWLPFINKDMVKLFRASNYKAQKATTAVIKQNVKTNAFEVMQNLVKKGLTGAIRKRALEFLRDPEYLQVIYRELRKRGEDKTLKIIGEAAKAELEYEQEIEEWAEK